ncbi:hypothetical protein SAMN02787142_5169 [Burkholderia sp. WP9]|nr:hypothetical protein SAMN02787142_5169 [Burkholderia sp. WP9]
MIRRLLFAAIAMTFGAGTSAAQTKSTSVGDFVGKWVVTDVVDYSDISRGILEAKRILGKTITITPKSIAFDKESCVPRPGFTVIDVDTETELNRQFGLTVNETGLPARTTLLHSENCFAVFGMSDYKIVFGWDGIIVRAISEK